MKQKKFIRLIAFVLALTSLAVFAGCKNTAETPVTDPTTVPTTAPTEPACAHQFTEWAMQASPSCAKEGWETRYCKLCKAKEGRDIAKTAHDLAPNHICRVCKYVDFNPDAAIVELGNIVATNYEPGHIANCAWDLVVWNGMLYRAAGDYDKNTGVVPIWAYDITNQCWKLTGEAKEESLHRFVQIGTALATPGIDPRESWTWGNFYVLSNGGWLQYRNLPGGIHNFDIIEFEGKVFAGLGVDENKSPCVVSTDQGRTFHYIPMYRDGKEVDSTGMTFIRIYEFMVLKGELYAMASFESDWGFYRYEEDKFVYVGSAASYVYGSRTNYNYLNAKIEMGDTCFLVSNRLHAVKDFSNPSANQLVAMPNNEGVSDALLQDGILYTLTYAQKADGTYETIIYKSTTGEAGSFTEVLRFDYAVPPCSFTLDNGYFYIGMGSKQITHTANGMVLRAKLS